MWVKIIKILHILSIVLLSSCAYRFTNRHIYVPDGGKTIAIAPIYNSSRIVLPHDILWSALQQAFGSSGHLIVSTPARADYFLQTHIKDARSAEYETDAKGTPQNPQMFLGSNNVPLAPSAYVDLHAADIYSKRESLSFVAIIEIWDLRTRVLLLKKAYPLSSNFNMDAVLSTIESRYIRNEENFELFFASLAKGLAQSVVADLFTSPAFTVQPP